MHSEGDRPAFDSGRRQPQGPYDPAGQPQGPYAPGAPAGQPAPHLVVVRAGLKYTALQSAGTVLCLGIGGIAMITGILKPDVDGRWFAIIAGGVFALIGLALVWQLPRVLRTRRYTFTAAGLEGQNYSLGTFTLPWSAVQSIAVQAYRRRSLWELMRRRHVRNSTTAYLQITTEPGTDLSGQIAPLSFNNKVTIPFWSSQELIHSMAYGSSTHAGEKFRGVTML